MSLTNVDSNYLHKIGIIVPANIKFAPYVNYYIKILNKSGIRYDIISWNKKGLKEDVDFAFNFRNSDRFILNRLLGFLLFSAFVKKISTKKKYGKIIVFTVAPSIFLSRFLLKVYSSNFILDVRDYSPFVRLVPSIFKKIVGNAKYIVSSSPEYLKWIGRSSIICHNIDIDLIREELSNPIPINKDYSKKVLFKIMFAGSLIEEAINIRLISHFKDSKHIIFSFYGNQTEGRRKLEDYSRQNGLSNIEYFSTYKKEDIQNLYRDNADFVNIIRENSDINSNALPNKLYDAALAAVPILVFSHNTAVAKYVEEFNLGIVLEEDNLFSVGNDFYTLLQGFNYEKYLIGRIHFLEKVSQDYELFECSITNFINQN